MATLTLRLVKGSTLNFTELDNNLIALNNEKIERDGSVPFTGAQRFIAGTAAAPGITFVGDTNTGIFSPGADQIGFATNGVSRLTIDASGNISFSGTLSGNGSGLTSLNASNISSGTLADGRLSSNVALRNAANVFSANEQTIDTTASAGYWIARAQNNPGFGWWANAPAADNRRWFALMIGSNLEIRSYNDALSSSQIALQFSRSGTVPGTISTYSHIDVGGNQASIGRLFVYAGTGTTSGLIGFMNPSGGREGYIGSTTTTAGSDAGTIPYVAGIHSFTGNIDIAGTGRRILGDFSSATISNRVLFQTSVANGTTALGVIPNGSATIGAYNVYASSDPANSSFGQLAVFGGSEVRISSSITGTGTLLPLRFYISGTSALEIATNRISSFSAAARTVPVSVSFSATPTFDAAQSNVFYFGTLTGNVTSMTVNNLSDGQTINIRFVQDSTGGRTVTPPSGSQISGSINSAANSVTWLVATYVASASRLEGTWTRVS